MNKEELKEQLKGLFNDSVDNIFGGILKNIDPETAKKLICLIEDFENQMDLILWCNCGYAH